MENAQQSIPSKYFLYKVTKHHIPAELQEKMAYIEQNISLVAGDLIESGRGKIFLKDKQSLEKAFAMRENLVRSRILNLKQEQKGLMRELSAIQAELSEKQTKKQRKTEKIVISKPLTNYELNKLTRKYRQFERQLQMKSQFIKLEEEEWKERQVVTKEQLKNMKRVQKREKIGKKIKEIQKKKKDREIRKEEEKSAMKKLKKKKLYEKMLENYNQHFNTIEADKLQKHQREKAMMSVDLERLRDHEIEYQNNLEQKAEKRSQMLKEGQANLSKINPYKSVFYQNVIQQDKRKQEQNENKKEQARIMNKIHRDYEQKVLREFSPQTRPLQQNHEKRTLPRKALDRQNMKKIGNQYYSLGQSRVKKNKSEEKQNFSKNYYQDNSSQAYKQRKYYPNYLPQILKFHKIDSSKRNVEKLCKKKIKKILQQDSREFNEKLEEIQFQINQFYPTSSYSTDDSTFMKKLKAKLELLSMIN